MKRILVVEDSEVEGLYIQGIMSKIEGIRTYVVRSYNEALDRCRQESFDLIIIDVIVPDGDAGELITSINKEGVNKEISAIAMGSAKDFAENDYIEKNGFANYVEKPVAFNMLKAVISMYA